MSEEFNEDGGFRDRIEEDPTKIDINQDPKKLAKGFWGFLQSTLSLKDGVDAPGTIRTVKEDIEFKGFNVWVLICSILIASIGLNMNSPAVIIGAMLISPLMGPIRGIGLAVGINDFKLLVKSLINFGVMAGISLLTSWIYFSITPLSAEQPEMLSRTEPTPLDVLVALFGGLAGIIATTRGAKSTVVPGVAIATALMPPLCTAGYGLAEGKMAFFFGASYLFLLNSMFICISTLVVIRYLDFPKVEFLVRKTEKKVQRYIIVFVLLIMVPSGIIFYGVIRKSIFNQQSTEYIENVISYKGAAINKGSTELKYDPDEPIIEIYLVGKVVPEDAIEGWRSKLKNYGLENTELIVHQNELSPIVNNDGVSSEDWIKWQDRSQATQEKLMADNRKKLDRILELEDELQMLKKSSFEVDMPMINQKMKLNDKFQHVQSVAIGSGISTSMSGQLDTIVICTVKWDTTLNYMQRIPLEYDLSKFLKLELNQDTIHVVNY
jgi:uncharacterized hydrophobic protein (TIGR00271 family)